jgi:rhodanese-related sulfurtransferase
MLWTILTLIVVVGGWYAFEAYWDRRLFTPNPGHICVNLSADDSQRYLTQHPETQVLDVRSDSEFQGGSLPGAINISVGDPAFETKVATLSKNKPVLVYCAGGFRSRKAVKRLKLAGFQNIQHLHRGYMSWSKPVSPS